MARDALWRAALAALLILPLISPVVFAQHSTSNPDGNFLATPQVTSPGPPQASHSGGQTSPQSGAVAPPRRLRQPDPELAAISQAEREGREVDAKQLLTAAIQKTERQPGSERRLSRLYNNLAGVNMKLSQYDEAAAAVRRAIDYDKIAYGPGSAAVANDLSNLAVMTGARGGKAAEASAEQYYKQALAIARQNPGQHSALLLMVLNNLAGLYLRQKRPADAEPVIDEALQHCTNGPGPKPIQCASFRALLAQDYRLEGHSNAAESMSFEAATAGAAPNQPWREKLMNLYTLARQYEQDGSYDLAETTYRQALALVQTNTKPNRPAELTGVMDALGRVLVKEGQNSAAEDLFRQALNLQEQSASSMPPGLPLWLDYSPLLNLYRTEGRLADMEPVIQQGIAIQEKLSGSGKEPLAWSLQTLAQVYEEEKKYSDAEPLCESALKIQEADYGTGNPRLLGAISTYADVLRHLGKTAEADALNARARAINQKYAAQRQP